jgi:hypothetical protein
MKMTRCIAIVALVLAVAPGVCWGEMTIERVTKQRAKELGMEIRARAAGGDVVRVELEFPTKGELKEFGRVELEVKEAAKLVVSARLREDKTGPERVVVRFAVDRTKLDGVTLRVVVSEAALGGSGFEVRVRDFVDLAKL